MDPLSVLVSPSMSTLSSTSSSDVETEIENVETRSPNLGYTYKMDRISGKMEKVDDKTARLSAELRRYGEEVIPSMPTTPSMSTYCYYATPMRRIFAPDGNVNRIFEQFPSVDEDYIKQLMKLYNNRENLVISALLSEGHTRPNFIIDESLFYKMKASFPNVENEIIRKVLIRNENKEHAAIASLLGMYGLFNTVRYKYSGDELKVKYVKLKYLKRHYPDISEQVLLDLLFQHEHNAQKVVDYLSKRGCLQSDMKIKISKVSEVSAVKQAMAKLNIPRPKELFYIQKEHANFEEQESIKRELQEKFKHIDPRLITIACEAADFESDLAICFIETMTLQDGPEYITETVQQRFFPPQIIKTSRWTQTSFEFQDLFGDLIFDVEVAPDPVPRPIPRSISEAYIETVDIEPKIMKDQSTWTKEDWKLTRRPVIKVSSERCKANGPSVPPEERPKKCEPIKERLKAMGSQCKALGSTSKTGEKLKPTERCRALGSAGRTTVRIKEQVQYNSEDDIIEVDKFIF